MDFRSSPAMLTNVAITATIQQGSVVHQLFLSVWPNVWFQDGPVQPFSVPSCWNPMQRPQLCCLLSATFHQAVKLRSRRLQSASDIFSVSLTAQHHYAHSIGLQIRVVSCVAVCDRSHMLPCTKLSNKPFSIPRVFLQGRPVTTLLV